MATDGAVVVFRRPLEQLLMDAVATPLFLALFAGLLVSRATAAMGPFFEIGFLGGVGTLLALSFVRTLRHGIPRDAVRVGPAGIWFAESGWIAWEEIREVRLEVLPGRGRGVRRLGVVPLDPELAVRVPLVQWAARILWAPLLRTFNPYTLGEPLVPAPFGVVEPNVRDGLAPVVAAIAPYREVAERRGALAAMP